MSIHEGWMTLGGRTGPDGKKHGGSRVYVKDGRITKGHPSLTGKRIEALREPADTTHRQELRQGKEYERAVWARRARKEGIDPKDLHQLAAEVLAHDRAFTDDKLKVLQDARRLHRNLGYGDLRNLKMRDATGRIDSESVTGLDDTAERMAERYPEFFRGHFPIERLYDLLAAGNPEPMTEEDAYRQAFDHLAEEREPWQVSDDEVIPFRRLAEEHAPKSEFLRALQYASEHGVDYEDARQQVLKYRRGDDSDDGAEGAEEPVTGLDVLEDARKLYRSLGYGDLLHLRLRGPGNQIEPDHHHGVMETAVRLAQRHPAFFGDQDPLERLWQMVTASRPETRDEDELPRRRLEAIADQHDQGREKPLPFRRLEYPLPDSTFLAALEYARRHECSYDEAERQVLKARKRK